MARFIYYLTEFDMAGLDRAVESMKSRFGITADLNNIDFMALDGSTSICSRFDALIALPGTWEISALLRETSLRDNQVHGTKFKLTVNVEMGEGHEAKKAIDHMVYIMKNDMPDKFFSMDHFMAFTGDFVEVSVANVPENLLFSAQRAMERVFADYSKRGTLHFSNIPEKARGRIRLEVKEGEFRYVDVNKYDVYEKDGFAVAAAIARIMDFTGAMFYTVNVIVKSDQAHQISGLFDDTFEETMISWCDIKGGKFTGDQKIIKIKDKPTLNDLVLEPGVLEKVKREIFDFFKSRAIYEKTNLPFKRGVALYGPPGTGKTMIAKIVAGTMEETVIWVKAGDIVTVDDINRIFRMARMGSPSVIILEDIDFYTEDRDSVAANKIGIATLMANLDGLEENDGILVIITTNRIDAIEKAIIERPGRIDSRIFIGELGKERIAELLEKKLGKVRKTFATFRDVVPEHTVLTGAAVVELSTGIMKQVISRSEGHESEIVICESDVHKALKEMQRNENRARAGFAQAM